MGTRTAGVLLAVLLVAGCTRERFDGPLRLLETATTMGQAPRTATLALAGEDRPALVESASFRTLLPRRGLLTFALGVQWAGEGDPPGWFRFAVKAGGKTLIERNVNPRTLRGWRDLTVPLEEIGRHTTLDFALRFTDKDGKDLPKPAGLTLAVAEPTVHDRADYGNAPGVILVSIDTVRRDHVGAYGYGRPTTPRFDRLAKAGILATDAVSTSSWTLPAHLSMLTGLDAGAHGGTDMSHGFNRKVPTLAAHLKEKRWATHAVTSHLYVSAVYGLDHGFDHLDFHQDRPGKEVADRAMSLLDRLGDRPFFLFLHMYDPHWHYAPPAETRRLFERPYEGTTTGLWQDFSKKEPAKLAPADVQHLLDLYDGEIRAADDALGAVLDHARTLGLDRSTLVIVTSDHGEEFGEHGSWEHQKTLYEEVVRIPLVVAGPWVEARREDAQTSLLDVVPTIADWTRIPWPSALPGKSLLSPTGDREAYGDTHHTIDHNPKLFLRAGHDRWKAIVTIGKEDGRVLGEEWYDLAGDPGERRSTPPPAQRAEELRRRALSRWKQARQGSAEAPAVSLTPEQRERLRALGYVAP